MRNGRWGRVRLLGRTWTSGHGPELASLGRWISRHRVLHSASSSMKRRTPAGGVGGDGIRWGLMFGSRRRRAVRVWIGVGRTLAFEPGGGLDTVQRPRSPWIGRIGNMRAMGRGSLGGGGRRRGRRCVEVVMKRIVAGRIRRWGSVGTVVFRLDRGRTGNRRCAVIGLGDGG